MRCQRARQSATSPSRIESLTATVSPTPSVYDGSIARYDVSDGRQGEERCRRILDRPAPVLPRENGPLRRVAADAVHRRDVDGAGVGPQLPDVHVDGAAEWKAGGADDQAGDEKGAEDTRRGRRPFEEHGASLTSVDVPVPVGFLGSSSGIHVELAAHAVHPPLQIAVLDFRGEAAASALEVDVADGQSAQVGRWRRPRRRHPPS